MRKGGSERTFAHGPSFGAFARTGLTAPDGFCAGVFEGYAMTTRYLTLELRAAWCFEEFTNERITGRTRDASAELRASYVWDLPLGLGIDVGASAGAAWLHQSFTTRGLAPDRDIAAATIGSLIGLVWELPFGLSSRIGLDGRTYVMWTEVDRKAVLTTPLVASGSLSISKAF